MKINLHYVKCSLGLLLFLGTFSWSPSWIKQAWSKSSVLMTDFSSNVARRTFDALEDLIDFISLVSHAVIFPKVSRTRRSVRPEKRESDYVQWIKDETLRIRHHLILPYDRNYTRGDAGKICMIGGSDEFSGPLYFAAITALKTGADLVYVVTTERVAPIIRRFSPDLRVYPYLNYDLEFVQSSNETITRIEDYETEKKYKYKDWTPKMLNDRYFRNIERIKKILNRMDVIVLGLGMSKDERVMPMYKIIVEYCREKEKPLIITHHGIYWLSRNFSLVNNYPPIGAILVFNNREMAVLKRAMEAKQFKGFGSLGFHVFFLVTGRADYFLLDTTNKDPNVNGRNWIDNWYVKHGGSRRRSAGQGHMLTGAIATYFHWALNAIGYRGKGTRQNNRTAACDSCLAGCLLIRKCNELAHARYGRSMITSNMIAEIHMASEILFETNSTALRKPKPEHCEFDTSHEFGHIPVEDNNINTTEETPATTTESPPEIDRPRDK